ncbi:MAG TPA: hypothetical protein VL422_01800 [Miltoncostaea sp.]|jgi:hypothetical protein|nr:hypothetical protein [Miltoncostaea sp.]
MAKIYHCPCGYTVRGATDEVFLVEARRHIDEAHPDLVGALSDDDLLAMASDGA